MSSSSGHAPVVGQWYSVVCPTCFSSVSFECLSKRTYGIKCSSCGTIIDLRNPTSPLPDDDMGRLPSSTSGGEDDDADAVWYSKEVEESDGLTAAAQVNILINTVEERKSRTIPKHMSAETNNAFAAQRNQAMAEKFSFLYPVTYLIEYLVFGNKPTARIGHVRIFRKKIPFKGYVNIPVPKTTTSYAAPTTFTLLLYLGYNWFGNTVDLDWMNTCLLVEHFLVFFFYVFMYRLAYSDPGYVRPAYVDNEQRLNDEMTLKDIENDQRESIWESVNGVAMERKWCSTCEMHRPIRAAHCYLCGLCCYDHDHHCSVIGVCVGRRRVELFAFFVWLTSSALLVPIFSTAIAWWGHSDKLTTYQNYGTTVLFIALLLFGIPITMTAVSMSLSILEEATTRERMQGAYANKRNPFDRGVIRNIRYHLFQRKLEPTLFDDEFVKLCQMREMKRELGTGKTLTCF